MLQIKLLTSIESVCAIRNEWIEIYESNNELSPFQSYEWNIALLKSDAYVGKINYYCLYKQEKIILIAPFLRRNKVVFTELRFLGEKTHADYLNFIYHKDLQYEDFYYFINALIGNRSNLIIHLDLLHGSSRINSFAARLPVGQTHYRTTCVKVPIGGSIDEFHSTLSKRVKSKVRRCQSHLENSSLEVEYRFTEDRKLDESYIDEVLRLYKNRCVEQKRQVNLKSLNVIKQCLNENRNYFLAECYINKKIAAVFLGFISPGGTICAPITAYDSAYRDYSIGIVLLYNTICFLTNQKKRACFDLTRGTEEYKYKIGGVEHYCNSFILCKAKIVACLCLYVPYFSCQCKLKLQNEISHLYSNLLKVH